jgi:hypothetical protein
MHVALPAAHARDAARMSDHRPASGLDQPTPPPPFASPEQAPQIKATRRPNRLGDSGLDCHFNEEVEHLVKRILQRRQRIHAVADVAREAQRKFGGQVFRGLELFVEARQLRDVRIQVDRQPRPA